jgi:biotin synthase
LSLPQICTTHGHAGRLATIKQVNSAGLSLCSGLITGPGESDDEIIDVVFALRDPGSESILMNFLMPLDGTPLAGTELLSPMRCRRILAMARLACPAAEIRMAGGRGMHLRSLQPLALHLASSLFPGGYLTSVGQAAKAALTMIADAGFRVLSGPPEPAGSGRARAAVRLRGAGADLAPNA